MTNALTRYSLLSSIGAMLLMSGCAASPDTTPPVISDVQLVDAQGAPVGAAVITDLGDAIVYCAVTASDVGTGVVDTTCALNSPNNLHQAACTLSDVSQVVGDASSGVWKCPIRFKSGYEGGAWRLTVSARDGVFNRTVYESDNFPPEGSGWDTGLTVSYPSSGTLIVDMSALPAQCSGASWLLTGPEGGSSGTSSLDLLVPDGTYTLIWLDTAFACSPPASSQVTVTGSQELVSLSGNNYAVRPTVSWDVDVRQDNGACGADPTCAGFGGWTLTSTQMYANAYNESGVGDQPIAGPIYSGRQYRLVPAPESGFTTPIPTDPIAGLTTAPLVVDYVSTVGGGGGAGGAGGAGGVGGTCVPITCLGENYACGLNIPDGCAGFITCGDVGGGCVTPGEDCSGAPSYTCAPPVGASNVNIVMNGTAPDATTWELLDATDAVIASGTKLTAGTVDVTGETGPFYVRWGWDNDHWPRPWTDSATFPVNANDRYYASDSKAAGSTFTAIYEARPTDKSQMKMGFNIQQNSPYLGTDTYSDSIRARYSNDAVRSTSPWNDIWPAGDNANTCSDNSGNPGDPCPGQATACSGGDNPGAPCPDGDVDCPNGTCVVHCTGGGTCLNGEATTEFRFVSPEPGPQTFWIFWEGDGDVNIYRRGFTNNFLPNDGTSNRSNKETLSAANGEAGISFTVDVSHSPLLRSPNATAGVLTVGPGPQTLSNIEIVHESYLGGPTPSSTDSEGEPYKCFRCIPGPNGAGQDGWYWQKGSDVTDDGGYCAANCASGNDHWLSTGKQEMLKHVSVLRFLQHEVNVMAHPVSECTDWGNCSSTLVYHGPGRQWSDTMFDPPRQIALTEGAGMQLRINTCNAANTDCWFTIPAWDNPAYQTAFLAAIEDDVTGLKPGLKAIIEFANEPWNYFQPYSFALKYMQHRAYHEMCIVQPWDEIDWTGAATEEVPPCTVTPGFEDLKTKIEDGAKCGSAQKYGGSISCSVEADCAAYPNHSCTGGKCLTADDGDACTADSDCVNVCRAKSAYESQYRYLAYREWKLAKEWWDTHGPGGALDPAVLHNRIRPVLNYQGAAPTQGAYDRTVLLTDGVTPLSFDGGATKSEDWLYAFATAYYTGTRYTGSPGTCGLADIYSTGAESEYWDYLAKKDLAREYWVNHWKQWEQSDSFLRGLKWWSYEGGGLEYNPKDAGNGCTDGTGCCAVPHDWYESFLYHETTAVEAAKTIMQLEADTQMDLYVNYADAFALDYFTGDCDGGTKNCSKAGFYGLGNTQPDDNKQRWRGIVDASDMIAVGAVVPGTGGTVGTGGTGGTGGTVGTGGTGGTGATGGIPASSCDAYVAGMTSPAGVDQAASELNTLATSTLQVNTWVYLESSGVPNVIILDDNELGSNPWTEASALVFFDNLGAFNQAGEGKISARDGTAYGCGLGDGDGAQGMDGCPTYTPGWYNVVIDVTLSETPRADRYTVQVGPCDGPLETIVTDAYFQIDDAPVGGDCSTGQCGLDYIGVWSGVGTNGRIDMIDKNSSPGYTWTANGVSDPGGPSDCENLTPTDQVAATPGADGYKASSVVYPEATSQLTFTATVDVDSTNALVALAQGGTTSFTDMAATLQCSAGGFWVSRNGGAMGAVETASCEICVDYDITFTVDIVSPQDRTYSTTVSDGVTTWTIANGYNFRTDNPDTSLDRYMLWKVAGPADEYIRLANPVWTPSP